MTNDSSADHIMSDFLEEIISEQESGFSEQPSLNNSVKTSDGEIMRLSKEFWEESPVLSERFANANSHLVLNAEIVLLPLIQASEDGVLPRGILEAYELLAAASELELQDMTSKCFNSLRSVNALDDNLDFPAELSVDAVMSVFKIFLDSPLRTADVYRSQLSRIARHCENNPDVMTIAMNLLKQSLGKYKSIKLEGLPVTFKTRRVPVVLYKLEGEFQTAVILESELKPVNLFGNRFNWRDFTGIITSAALSFEALCWDALHSNARYSDAQKLYALSSDAHESDALRSDAHKSNALRSDVRSFSSALKSTVTFA